MTDKEAIAEIAIENQKLKAYVERVKKLSLQMHNKIVGVGQPLNDNILRFDSKQMLWCYELQQLVHQLDYHE